MLTTPVEVPDTVEVSSSSFTEYLVVALSHFADARWLGTHSPFATPYFLGNVLTAIGSADSPQRRGQVLQRALLVAALTLDEPLEHADDIPLETLKDLLKHGTREQQLLYWKYFHHPKVPVEFIIDQMIVARATYHRNVKEKLPTLLLQLGQTVLRLVRPSLRLEPPPLTPLIGREELLDTIRATLEGNPVLMLDGMPGVGKTALTAGVAAQWPGPAFWYTVKPALNDSAGSFLLMLGLFLHTHGSSHLWSQMLVDGAAIQPQIAASLALADLKALAQMPLLCIDGTDVLHSSDLHRHGILQALLLALAEAPECNAKIIFIGQPLPVLNTAHLTVPTLDQAAVAEFLRQSKVQLPSDDQARAFEYTRGNIQALKMLAILYHAGETFDSMLERLPKLPSMVAFTNRLRHYLPPDEQRLISRLVVFRQPVPLHIWSDETAIIEQLRRRQLIHVHDAGSVSVWPALREAFYQVLSDQERQLNHRIAATIRTQSGQYTAAAYHYVRSGHPALAVQGWFPNREQEIRDGQTDAALALLQTIDPAALPERDARALALSIVQLSKLTGETLIALDTLQRTAWIPGQPLTAYARTLEGDLLDLRGQVEPALSAYEQALATVAGLLERQEVVAHTRLCNLHMNRFHDLDQAWKEACLARYTAELFQGEVVAAQGDQAAARIHYEQALEIARQLNDVFRQARTHFNLARLGYMHVEEYEQTLHHFEQTLRLYTQLGDYVRVARTRTNLAAFLIETERFHLAIETATEALAFFERVQFANWIAINATNLSEAYLAIGAYDQAEDYAQRVINTEEQASMPYVLTSLGHIRRHQQRYAEAEQLFHDAIETGQANANPYSAAIAWRGLGQTYADSRRPEKARPAFQHSLDLLNPLGFSREIARTTKLLEALSQSASA